MSGNRWNRTTQLLALAGVLSLAYVAQLTGLAGGTNLEAQACGGTVPADFATEQSGLTRKNQPSDVLGFGADNSASSIPEADYYTLWRRMTIDLCERIPTVDEVNSIESNITNNTPGLPTGYESILRDCVDSEIFAESIGRWVNDFILPAKLPLDIHTIKWNTFTCTETNQLYYYWYSDGWGDCQPESLDDLDIIYDPYWAATEDVEQITIYQDENDHNFIYGCKHNGVSIGDTNSTATLSNEKEIKCFNSDQRYPCGCGPNMRWCHIGSSFSRVRDDDVRDQAGAGNGGGFWTLKEQLLTEPSVLVKNIVLGASGLLQRDVPFTDIFNAEYVIRTSRLQQYYEIVQSAFDSRVDGKDACHRIIKGIDKDTDCPSLVPTSIDYLHRDIKEEWDWQEISMPDEISNPLAYQAGGVLTSLQFLARQPSEPNVAGQIYSFWTCENISWKSELYGNDWKLDAAQGILDSRSFSTLYRTTAALVPFDGSPDSDTNCKGCHLTVNPLAAFRNYWDYNGRYHHATSWVPEANGIFLGETGSSMTGLGDLMAESKVVHSCIVNRTFERLTGRRLQNSSSRLRSLTDDFAQSLDIKALYLAIIDTTEYRRAR